eukprot:10792325-Alexandrium_andersonii.AAC.1
MSASLVGSEMCIRDRWGAPASASSEARRRPFGPSCELGKRPHRVRPWACLLYTSDAADDM